MSRINVEDGLFSDGRFIALSILLGDQVALGKLVIAWRTAQTYWTKGELVPIKLWEILGLGALIDTDFAEIREDGVYVRGSDDNFSWIDQKQISGRKGGLASGVSRKLKAEEKKLNEAMSNVIEATTNQNEGKVKQTKPPTPTPTPTINTSLVVSDKEDAASGVFDDIAALWNEMALLNALPKVKTPLSKDRRKKVKLALEEFKEYSDWVRIINGVVDNDFNLGVNDRKWKANFDWLFHTTRFNYRKLWEAGSEENN